MQPQMPPGKAIGFKPLAEEWNYYSLDDGFVLGIKMVLTKVLKTEQKDPSGIPVYMIQHQPAIQVLTPDEYRSITSRGTIQK
ncbi:MAG TPA: hypothetical protein VFF30_02115 [Nitrososphaerales archaeon]|nr:hypothetical protein [Nitrososphaerales archaeon]